MNTCPKCGKESYWGIVAGGEVCSSCGYGGVNFNKRKVMKKEMHIDTTSVGKIPVLYLDVETTGLDPVRNDIIRAAFIIEVGGLVVEERVFSVQPLSYENIDLGALAINGLTVDDIKKFDNPVKVYYQIKELFAKYVNKFERTKRFLVAGYNTKFDIDFLSKFFKQADPEDADTKYGLGSWIQWNRMFDMLSFLRNEAFYRNTELINFKLQTVAEANGIHEHVAHDALSDVRATRELIKIYGQRFFGVQK